MIQLQVAAGIGYALRLGVRSDLFHQAAAVKEVGAIFDDLADREIDCMSLD
jgi:hypothetical protein